MIFISIFMIKEIAKILKDRTNYFKKKDGVKIQPAYHERANNLAKKTEQLLAKFKRMIA